MGVSRDVTVSTWMSSVKVMAVTRKQVTSDVER